MHRTKRLLDALIVVATFLFTVAIVLASLAPARAATRWPTHVHDFRDRKMLDARGIDLEAR